ncbi:MAG: carboxypeptidase-like regulatory domain-containing protein [Acidobacteria bacterium]|nr:carboxypeptidase-like regulatory domain-containing protein [Acidobacteriota bacterium]
MVRRLTHILASFTLAVTAAAIGWAQEYRATLLGSVTDSSELVVPRAKVTTINAGTGVRTENTTNSEGNYVIPYLSPGGYLLRVEHPGFRTVERSRIELRMNDRVRIDIALEVGSLTDQVTVAAESPLLDVASANQGQTIDTRKVADLPLNKRNSILLTNVAAGVQFTGSPIYLKPYDNGVISNFSINGGANGKNEFQIDGITNTATLSSNDQEYVGLRVTRGVRAGIPRPDEHI